MESILGLLKSLKIRALHYHQHCAQSDTLYVIHFQVNFLELMCFVSQSLVQYYNLLALLRNKQLICIYKKDLLQQAWGAKKGSPLFKIFSLSSLLPDKKLSKMTENNRQADVFYDNQPFIPKENITTIWTFWIIQDLSLIGHLVIVLHTLHKVNISQCTILCEALPMPPDTTFFYFLKKSIA